MEEALALLNMLSMHSTSKCVHLDYIIPKNTERCCHAVLCDRQTWTDCSTLYTIQVKAQWPADCVMDGLNQIQDLRQACPL